jgi:predicted amidophosphoribosyltransferase
MSPTAIVACANHEGREAIGVCVRCRRRVCSECTTKIDGINHCVNCFAELAKEHAQDAKVSRADGPTASAVFVGLGFVVASALAWGVLELLSPGSP